MTYAPPPGYPPSYPPNYGYPAPRPSSAGKRAGIVLIIFGVLAGLMCAGLLYIARNPDAYLNAPEMQNNAEVQRMKQELEHAGFSFGTLLYVFACLVGGYAAVSLLTGIALLMSRSRAIVIWSIIFVVLILLLWGVNLLGSLLSGNIAGVVLAILYIGLHVLTLVWLIEAVRAAAAPMPATFPTPAYAPPGYAQPMPMQGYQYQPPPPPTQQKPLGQ